MVEKKLSSFKCDEEGCTVGINGICLNGLERSKCSHFYLSEQEEDEEEEEQDEVEDELLESDKEVLFETVYSGNALLINECKQITLSNLSRLIIFAGAAEAGKTTLACILLELFQKNASFANYLFAGSKTLIGFEKRSHESRIASDRRKPETRRTILSPAEFLHLKLRREGANTSICDLLFTDISGEYFDILKNSHQECVKFKLAKRADHFVLFLDANFLSDYKQRHKTKVDGLSILRSLIEAGVLSSDTNLEIVFSRWDLLKCKPNNEDHLLFIANVKNEVLHKFSTHFKNIRFFEVASRPNKNSDLKFGYGIEKLLPIWVEESPFINNEVLTKRSSTRTLIIKRQFSKYIHNQGK